MTTLPIGDWDPTSLDDEAVTDDAADALRTQVAGSATCADDRTVPVAGRKTSRFRSGSYLGDRLLQLAAERFGQPCRESEQHQAVQAVTESVGADADRETVTETARLAEEQSRNRRSYPRRLSECQVTLHRCEPGAPIRWIEKDWLLHSATLHGVLRDISMSGVALSVDEPFRTDDMVMVRISNSQFGTSVDTAGRVMRVSRSSEGYDVVLQLTKNLTLDEITPLRLQFSPEVEG